MADVVRDPSFLAATIAAGGGEESITQFLAGLLREKGLLAAYLSALVPEAHDLLVSGAIVRAEDEDGSDRGVPDLSIEVRSRLRVLVENKLGAAFTENQPHEYVKTLATWKREHPSGIAALVLQAPDGRLPTLLREASDRMESRAALQKDGECYGGVLLKGVGWSAVERTFESYLPTVTDPVFGFLLEAFLHLLRPSAEAIAKPITKEHIMHLTDPTVLEAIAAAEDLLRDVRGLLRLHKSEIKGSEDGLGIVFWPRNADGKADKAKEFYVGLYARVAARLRISPLMVQLTGRDYANIDALRQGGRHVVDEAEKLRVFGWVERPIVPIDLQPDLDPPAHAKKVAEEIELVRTIALSGSSSE